VIRLLLWTILVANDPAIVSYPARDSFFGSLRLIGQSQPSRSCTSVAWQLAREKSLVPKCSVIQ